MATPVDTQAAQAIERNDAAAQALADLQAQTQQVYTKASENLEAAKGDAQLVTSTKKLAEAEAGQRSQQFAADIGTDPSSANYMLRELATQYQASNQREREINASIDYATNIANIFDNPLKYVKEVIMYDFNVLRQNNAQKQTQSIQNQMQFLENVTQENARTMLAISRPVTVESARAEADLAGREIDAKKFSLDIEALRSNSDNILKTTQLKNNNLDIALKQRDQQLQEQQIEESRKQRALQAEQLRVSLEERKKEDADQAAMLAAINVGRQVNGNVAPLQSLTELKQLWSDPKQRDLLTQQFNAGRTAQDTGQASLAASPYDALKYVKRTGAKITDGRAKLVEFAEGSLGEATKATPQGTPNYRNETELAAGVNKVATDAAKKMHDNITAGGPKNIYAPPPVEAYLNDPEFSKTYLAQNILTPLSKSGAKELPIKNATTMLIQAAHDKKIPWSQVDSELGFLAEKTKFLNNDIYRYNATAGLPPMKAVNVPLDESSSIARAASDPKMTSQHIGWLGAALFGGPNERVVNIADPVARSAYINKEASKALPPILRQQAEQQDKTKVR